MDVEYKYGSDDDIPGTELDFQYVYGDDLVQPYLGFGFGFGLHTLKNEDNSFNDGDDLEGVSFKLQGGVKFDVHEHVELDLSLQIKINQHFKFHSKSMQIAIVFQTSFKKQKNN